MVKTGNFFGTAAFPKGAIGAQKELLVLNKVAGVGMDSDKGKVGTGFVFAGASGSSWEGAVDGVLGRACAAVAAAKDRCPRHVGNGEQRRWSGQTWWSSWH